MYRMIVVVACILLSRAPGMLCQEQHAPLFPHPACDDLHRGFSAPLHKMDKTCGPSADLPRLCPWRGPLTMDSHLSGAGHTQAAGGSAGVAQPQGKKPSEDHSYLIELSSAKRAITDQLCELSQMRALSAERVPIGLPSASK